MATVVKHGTIVSADLTCKGDVLVTGVVVTGGIVN